MVVRSNEETLLSTEQRSGGDYLNSPPAIGLESLPSLIGIESLSQERLASIDATVARVRDSWGWFKLLPLPPLTL
jgi:hypothetical protein